MGYYTDFSLQIDKQLVDQAGDIEKALKEISGYTRWRLQYGAISLGEAKWYNHLEDMQQLSERFPDLKLELHCHGEDGDQWMIYAFGGKSERCDGEVVFSPRSLW